MQIQPNCHRSSKGAKFPKYRGRSAPIATATGSRSLPWDCGKLYYGSVMTCAPPWAGSRFHWQRYAECGRCVCSDQVVDTALDPLNPFLRCKQDTHASPCIVFLAAMSLPSPIVSAHPPNAPPFLHTIGFIKSHFDKRSNISQSQMVQWFYPSVSTINLKLQCSHRVAR
jgi:hypothetical protein